MPKILDIKERKTEEETLPSRTFIKWEAREDEMVDWRWQLGVNIFLVFFFGIFLSQKNYWGTGLMILIFFLILGLQKQKTLHSFAIQEKGIKIDKEMVPFSRLKSFWIFGNPPELFLEKKKGFSSWFLIPIKKEDQSRIERILEDLLPKREQERGFLDLLIRKVGL